MKHNSANGNDAAWLSKPEALKLLQTSERSLDRMVTAGKVEKQQRPRPGRTPEPVYKRSDVERQSARDAHLMPPAGPGEALIAAPHAPPLQFPALAAAIAPLLAILDAGSRPRASTPAWLSLEAASQHTGLSSKLLRKLIREGELPALKDGSEWKIRREDLNAIRAAFPADSAKRASPAPLARSARAGGRA